MHTGMRMVGLAAICLAASLGVAGQGQDAAESTGALSSPDRYVREACARGILRRREQEIASVEGVLKDALRDETRKGTARTAIVLLGNLRADRSVPLLVENLDLEVYYLEANRPQPPEDLYPCMGALIQIGMPSLAPVVARATSSDDKMVCRCAAWVVKGVLGKDLAMAYVRERLAQTADAAQKTRLEALLRNVEASRWTETWASPEK